MLVRALICSCLWTCRWHVSGLATTQYSPVCFWLAPRPSAFPGKNRLCSPFARRTSEPQFANFTPPALPKFQLDRLCQLANATVAESWRVMEEDYDEGSSSRSASGGTTWADGGWVDGRHLSALEDMIGLTTADTRTGSWLWLLRAPRPWYVPLVETARFDLTLIVLPSGCITPPWRRPTGLLPPSHPLLSCYPCPSPSCP